MNDAAREAERRAIHGLPPYGLRCDYLHCRTTATVGGIGTRWRLCAEHLKPEYHPRDVVLTYDAATSSKGAS